MNKNNYRETKYNQPFTLQRADPYDKVILRVADTVKGLAEATEKTLWVKHEAGSQSVHIWAIRPYVLHCKGKDPMQEW